ncbi:MAG: hypothetical protein AB9866_28630 [Syntrophobacteraceae bacterium]
MVFLFVLIFVILLPIYLANRIGGHVSGKKLASIISVSSVIFLVLLSLADYYTPFTDGSDDISYYYNSLRPLQSFDSLTYSISHYHEQPGYPLFLTFVNSIVDDSLFARKAANIFFFLAIALCWYLIGLKIGGRLTAYRFFIGILLSTPLWFYFLFLLKDMAITVLFSLFILGTVEFFSEKKGIKLMLISSFCLALFRLPLLAINIALLIAFSLFLGRTKGTLRYTVSVVLILFMLLIGTNIHFLETVGIASTRSLSVGSLMSQAQERAGMSENIPVSKSILLYFLIETSGFRSIDTWDDTSLRGLTALPWIFIGLPLFFVGSYGIVKCSYRYGTVENRGFLCLLFVVAVYFALSLIVKDSTRWRIPGFPAMAAVAAVGWGRMGKRILPFLAFTVSGSVMFFVLYYLLKS